MNEHDQGPLPPDVAEALAAERARPGVDATTRARLRARLYASLPAGPGGGGATSPPVPQRPASSPFRLLRAAHPGATALIGFIVGVTTGVAAQTWLAGKTTPAPAPVPNVVVQQPSRVPETPPLPALPESPAAEAAPPARVEAPVPSAPTLSAERALLDVAHAALAKGEAAEALDALSRHERKFPRGVYREEREALTVQSLRALGRSVEATRRATAFDARYPNSLFRSIVDPS